MSQGENVANQPSLEEQSQEETLINQMLNKGRSLLFTWTTVGDDGISGFQSIHEEGQVPLRGMQGRDSDYRGNPIGLILPDRQDNNVWEEMLCRNRIFETTVITPLMKDVYQTRTIWVAKKRFFRTHQEAVEERYKSGETSKTMDEATGNGSVESACAVYYHVYAGSASDLPVVDRYTNIQGRPGNKLEMKVIIPVDLGRQIAGAIKQNPAFIRKVTEEFIQRRYSERFKQEIWSKPGQGRPPYDIWSGYNSRMYLVNLLEDGIGKRGFDPANVLDFKK